MVMNNLQEKATFSRYDKRAAVLKALGHPTRLFIVDQLAQKERCVCELQEMVGADMSTVSKHLAILKSVGLVNDDKRGKQVFYSLRIPCVLNFLGCVESVLQADAQERMEALQ
jgi:DNA-binding transcriptional ArsR family regulator